MGDAIVYHLRDNSLINFKSVIRLCSERVSPDAEIKFLLDEFYCLIGNIKEISLKPLIRTSRLFALFSIPENTLDARRRGVKMGIFSKAEHRCTVWHAIGYHLEMCQHLLQWGILRKWETSFLAGGVDKPANLVLVQFIPFPDRFLFI